MPGFLPRKVYLIFFFLFFLVFKPQAQVNIGGVINQYSAVTGGFVSCTNSYTVANPSIFNVGDRVMIIQVKGSQIKQNNLPDFGEILNINASGGYQLANILAIDGNKISFVNKLTSGFGTGGTQMIKIPVYQDANITSTLTCLPWNGSIGGVLAFEVKGTLTFLNDIDVSENGFRGGAASGDFYDPMDCGSADYFYPLASKRGGFKGEGNSTLPTTHQLGRGPLSVGGGGGNHANSGGGGGANGGAGGKGGNEWSACLSSPVGGLGGLALDYSSTTIDYKIRAFLGGGGGGGQENDSQGSAGKNGGGIVWIEANTMVGNGFKITANGGNGTLSTIDGAGGGGAGGTILLKVANYAGNLILEAKGGKGGDNNSGNTGTACHGPGGGGGGGVIRHTGASLPAGFTTNVSGGAAGIITFSGSPCYNTSYGATVGSPGFVEGNFSKNEGTVPYFPITFNELTTHVKCTGQNDGEIDLNVTGGEAPYSYQWFPNVGGGNPVTGLAPGTYKVIVTGVNMCKDSTEVTVTEPPPLFLQSVLVADATCGHPNGEIKVEAGGGVGAYTYDWPSLGQTTDSVTGLAAGNYEVIVKDTNNCEFKQTITVVNQSPATPAPAVTSPVNYCLNETAVPLTATPSSGTAVINWYGTSMAGPAQPISPVPSTVATGSTWYYLTQTDNNCESVFDSIEVAVYQAPTVNANLINPDCGYMTGQIHLTVSGSGNFSYLWSPGNETTSSITALDTGKYAVTITYGNNCTVTETYQLIPGFIPDPIVISPVGYCLNEIAQPLNATASPDYTLTWFDPISGLPQSSPITPGTASVGTSTYLVGQYFKDCISNPVPIDVTIKPLPQVVSPVQSICSGQSATLTASGADIYAFRVGGQLFSGNNVVITPVSDTSYRVIGTLSGCIDSVSSAVLILDNPVASINYTLSENFCETRTVYLEEILSGSYFSANWFYNGKKIGSGTKIDLMIMEETGPHLVKLILESHNGCKDTAEVGLEVSADDFLMYVYIPNSFSPNNDGLNDKWFVKGDCIDRLSYKIYDRWGQLIIESSDTGFAWDGSHNGKLLPCGVYLYEIYANGFLNNEMVRRGQINLIR